jgi:hypothetical protein
MAPAISGRYYPGDVPRGRVGSNELPSHDARTLSGVHLTNLLATIMLRTEALVYLSGTAYQPATAAEYRNARDTIGPGKMSHLCRFMWLC